MLELHLKRTNGMTFIVHCVTTLFIMVGLISQLTMSELPPSRSIIPMAFAIVALIGSIIMYIAKRTTYVFTRYEAIAYSLVYSAMVLTVPGNTAYPYMIPFLILFILSMDKIIVYGASVWFLIVNIAKVIMTIASGVTTDVIEAIMIEMIISIVVTLVSFLGVQVLTKFFDASIAEATAAADENKAISDKIVRVVDNVNDELVSANTAFTTIQTSMESLADSMKEISNAIVSNTEAIANETTETQAIKTVIDSTNKQMNEVVKTADETLELVSAGATSMDSLMKHVETAIEAGDQMKNSANSMQDRANEVRSITELIISISSQTNLLALNASIEAARAGEAGKGFAVVADEIRNLADQTKEATENITAILDKLAVNATEVVDKVEENVALSKEQSVYAGDATKQFNNIEQIISTLHNRMNDVAKKMEQITNSNDLIVDSVASLSASSEQMTAGVEEATAMCDTNLGVVDEFAETLNNITKELTDLNKN